MDRSFLEAFGLTVAVCVVYAGLLRVAAALVGIALAARVISLLVDGTYPAAFQPMVIEAVTLALALAGARHFGKNG